MGELILLRHGETEWSRTRRHTGRTDILLTPAGEAEAATLAPALAARPVAAVFTSPLQRAARTAELAGLSNAKQDPDLQEWDYGGYEGLTTEEIRSHRPGWYLWRDGVIPGDAAYSKSARGRTPCSRGCAHSWKREMSCSCRTATCCAW
jgi:broad specificity phosphatase PhoE